MLFGRGKEIFTLVSEHLDSVEQCLEEFTNAFKVLFAIGQGSELESLAASVDSLESKADESRHKIIKAMLGGALLPESRREILKLIELTDEVANKSEEAIRNITLQNIMFPDDIKGNITLINTKTREQYRLLRKSIESLFVTYEIMEIYEDIKEIELLESTVDTLEQDSIRKLYKMNIELAEKNQLREIISQISDVSDIIEDISDMIEIIMALRKV